MCLTSRCATTPPGRAAGEVLKMQMNNLRYYNYAAWQDLTELLALSDIAGAMLNFLEREKIYQVALPQGGTE